jgi:hypothetical protein
MPAVLTHGGSGPVQLAIASPTAWNNASIWADGAARRNAAKCG